MTSERRWWPGFLLDEIMPEGCASPDAWLAPDENGVTTLRDCDGESLLGTISPGEALTFNYYEPRGGLTIRVLPDGTWVGPEPRDRRTIDMFDGPPPEPKDDPAGPGDANQFWSDDDWDMQGDTIEEFARCYAEMESIEEEGALVDLRAGYWSPDFRFTVSADGKRLIAVTEEAAHA